MGSTDVVPLPALLPERQDGAEDARWVGPIDGVRIVEIREFRSRGPLARGHIAPVVETASYPLELPEAGFSASSISMTGMSSRMA